MTQTLETKLRNKARIVATRFFLSNADDFDSIDGCVEVFEEQLRIADDETLANDLHQVIVWAPFVEYSVPDLYDAYHNLVEDIYKEFSNAN